MRPGPERDFVEIVLIVGLCLVVFGGVVYVSVLGVRKLQADAQVPVQLGRIGDALEGKLNPNQRGRLAALDPKGYAFADCILALPKDHEVDEADIERCSK